MALSSTEMSTSADTPPSSSSPPSSPPPPPPPPPSSSSPPGLTPIRSFVPLLHEPNEDEEDVSWATGFSSRRRSLAHLAINTRASDKTADNLLPLLSPVAQAREQNTSPDKPYFPGQPKSLEGIALRAFGLGAALALSLVAMVLVLALTSSPLWRLPFFVGALSTFHFLEFWTTAKYNTPQATVAAFLLTANWPAYAIAHTAASLECLLTKLLCPGGLLGNRSWAPYFTGHAVLLLGFALVVGGQFIRSAAMVQAGQSFNHIVQHRKRDSHSLVTTGIYAKLRHPSYFGFFWWGIGTQLVLGNVVCLVAYTVVLWKFFSSRVKHEEAYLIRFFGDDYVEYKKKVPTMMPFIG
ncbi:farnesyl cysteine-carboxyl methyltransferase [Diatrype stigma]|uniref:Protein-S-isoprenylcysteine O-methyltransferase n=1 Tax=Diatrype stigma TaxID=117547 RepID=A0AAN9UWV7_9PEZI